MPYLFARIGWKRDQEKFKKTFKGLFNLKDVDVRAKDDVGLQFN